MRKRLVALAVAAVLTVAVAAQASTLTLKDGREYNGTYLGGTKDQVQFLINGEVKIFNTSDVATIDFATTAAPMAAPQPPAPVAPAAPMAPTTPAAPAAQGNSTALTQTVTVPQGTEIFIQMIDSIDSSVNKPGDIFHASLVNDLQIGNVIVAHRNADVYGKLVQVQSAGRVTGKSELALELTGIRTVNGTIQPIVTGEYHEAGKSRTKQTVEHSIGGAVLGGIIGAIAGGGGGAVKGAGIGAAAGAGVTLITHGQQIKVPSETLLKFLLAQPFMITVAKASE